MDVDKRFINLKQLGEQTLLLDPSVAVQDRSLVSPSVAPQPFSSCFAV